MILPRENIPPDLTHLEDVCFPVGEERGGDEEGQAPNKHDEVPANSFFLGQDFDILAKISTFFGVNFLTISFGQYFYILANMSTLHFRDFSLSLLWADILYIKNHVVFHVLQIIAPFLL